MAIDDRLEKTLDEYQRIVIATPGDLIIDAALNAIPYVGSSIAALLAGKAQERVRQRVADVFTAMKEKLDTVEEESVRKEYFVSEEFQTLLALTIEQLNTSHDKEKVRILAKALVNSGLTEFDTEMRKEVFVRALRELTTSHIAIIAELLPQTAPQVYPLARKSPTDRLLIQYLVALGFVEEVDKTPAILSRAARSGRKLSLESAVSALSEAASAMSEKKYKLSELGTAFLAFLDVKERPPQGRAIPPMS
jgi:hypothetical protein